MYEEMTKVKSMYWDETKSELKVSKTELLISEVKFHAFYRALVILSGNCITLIKITRMYLTYVDFYLILTLIESTSDSYLIISRVNGLIYQNF